MNKSLLLIFALLVVTFGYSQTFTDNFITYQVTSTSPNEVTAKDYDNSGGGNTVTIPSSVTYNGDTYTVTSIGNFAFTGSPSTGTISSVSIPNTVSHIGEQAFAQNVLTSVVLPSSLQTIGGYAFQNNQLQGLTIPSNVTSIGNGAFRYNLLTSVTSLATTPPIITTVNSQDDTFFNARSSIDLTIPAGTSGPYVTDAGALWTGFNTVTENLNTGDTYVYNYITYEVTNVANSTVKAIDYDSAGGASVTIPATIPNGQITYSVTEIGYSAFGNKSLTSLTLSNGLISIDGFAFSGNMLVNVTLPNSLTTIGASAFKSNQLTTIVIPDSVTNIGIEAFYDNNISSATLPSTLTSIPANLFAYNNFTTYTLPSNITTIELGAFQYNSLTSIDLGSNVTSIGIAAFKDNQLTSVTIPDTVTSIGNLGFQNNPLTSVTTLATTPPTINTTGDQYDTFSSDRSTIHLHIPAGTMGAYVTDAGALWTGFNPVTEDATAGIADFDFEQQIKIITSENSVSVSSPSSLLLNSYSLYNLNGQNIQSGKEKTISTTTLAKGIYVLQLEFNKGTVVKKVVLY